MSDADEEAPADLPPPRPRPPMIVVALLVVNLLASGFLVFQTVTRPAHATGAPAKESVEAPRKEVVGPMVVLEPFVVNLDEPGTSRYLKVQLQAEMIDAAAAKTLERNKTLVRDGVLGYLSGLKVAETLGAASKDRIRTALEEQVAEIVGEGRVRRIIFADFVVQ